MTYLGIQGDLVPPARGFVFVASSPINKLLHQFTNLGVDKLWMLIRAQGIKVTSWLGHVRGGRVLWEVRATQAWSEYSRW